MSSSRREHALLLSEQCPWHWELIQLTRSYLSPNALLCFPPSYSNNLTWVPICGDSCHCPLQGTRASAAHTVSPMVIRAPAAHTMSPAVTQGPAAHTMSPVVTQGPTAHTASPGVTQAWRRRQQQRAALAHSAGALGRGCWPVRGKVLHREPARRPPVLLPTTVTWAMLLGRPAARSPQPAPGGISLPWGCDGPAAPALSPTAHMGQAAGRSAHLLHQGHQHCINWACRGFSSLVSLPLNTR